MADGFYQDYRFSAISRNGNGIPSQNSVKHLAYTVAEMAKELSQNMNISFNDAIKCVEFGLKVNDLDAKDEQLKAFSLIFENISDNLG